MLIQYILKCYKYILQYNKKFDKINNTYSIDDKLEQIKIFKENLYDSYLKEEISKEVCLKEKDKLNKKEVESKNSKDEAIEYSTFDEEINLKEVVESFIEEVIVFDDERIEIYFKN